jgi:beta-phosphoglucomutase-like phosphatase (HAD superfamily)
VPLLPKRMHVGNISQISSGASEASYGWTIVTSASNIYTPRALERCGVPLPPAGAVTSNDVSQGKPHPDPYLAGAKKCNVDPRNCKLLAPQILGFIALLMILYRFGC